MTKLKLTMTAVCVLAMAGCAGDREPSTVRNGPQVESPHANAPGGKMPDNGGAGTVIIDDSAAGQIDAFAAGATSIVQRIN